MEQSQFEHTSVIVVVVLVVVVVVQHSSSNSSSNVKIMLKHYLLFRN